MKTKKSLKILSFAMCLVLIFLAFSVCTYAVDYEEQINSEVNEAFVDYFWECVENE